MYGLSIAIALIGTIFALSNNHQPFCRLGLKQVDVVFSLFAESSTMAYSIAIKQTQLGGARSRVESVTSC